MQAHHLLCHSHQRCFWRCLLPVRSPDMLGHEEKAWTLCTPCQELPGSQVRLVGLDRNVCVIFAYGLLNTSLRKEYPYNLRLIHLRVLCKWINRQIVQWGNNASFCYLIQHGLKFMCHQRIQIIGSEELSQRRQRTWVNPGGVWTPYQLLQP